MIVQNMLHENFLMARMRLGLMGVDPLSEVEVGVPGGSSRLPRLLVPIRFGGGWGSREKEHELGISLVWMLLGGCRGCVMAVRRLWLVSWGMEQTCECIRCVHRLRILHEAG